jgi:hypothetical protein
MGVPECERRDMDADTMNDACEGWAEQFRAMVECGDEELLDVNAVPLEWYEEEWEW